MANPSYLKTLFGGVEPVLRRSLDAAWDYILGNLRLGQPEHQTRSENFQAYFYNTTTPAVANTEFSIAHGLGRAPYLLIPILPLDVGAQLVRLSVSRAPDAARVYLKSPETNAPVTILLEG
jgi:hypothetical protein